MEFGIIRMGLLLRIGLLLRPSRKSIGSGRQSQLLKSGFLRYDRGLKAAGTVLTLCCFIFEVLFVELDPNEKEKGNCNNDGKDDSEISHFVISFPSNTRPTIKGIMVAKIPITKIQNRSPDELAI